MRAIVFIDMLLFSQTELMFILLSALFLATNGLLGLEICWGGDEGPGAFWSTRDSFTLYSVDESTIERWERAIHSRVKGKGRSSAQGTTTSSVRSPEKSNSGGVNPDTRGIQATLSWYEGASRTIRFDAHAMEPMPTIPLSGSSS